MRAAASLTNALAACASANSAPSSSPLPSDAGLAARCSSISVAARDKDAARRGEIDRVVGHLHARSGIAVDPAGEAAAGELVGRLGDAERRRGVEEPGDEIALHVRQGIAGRKAAAHAGAGSSTPSSETELLPEARMPSASQSLLMTTPGASVGTIA